jgi:hypothetical protein
VIVLTFSIPQFAVWLPSRSSQHNVPFHCLHIYYAITCHLTAFMFIIPHYAVDCPYVHHTTICHVTCVLSLHYLTEEARNITTNTWHTKWASSMSRNNYHISCIDLNLISPCMKLESLPICSKCVKTKSDWCILPPCLLVFMAATSKLGQILSFLIRWSEWSLVKEWHTLNHRSCRTILAFTKVPHMQTVTLFYSFSFCALLYLCVCVYAWETVKHIITGFGQWNRDLYYFLRLPNVMAWGTDYYKGSSLTITCIHIKQ